MTETPKKAVKKAPAKSKFKDPVKAPVTCEFGKKGALWAAGFHTGTDYGCKKGTEVRAVADGVVIAANWGPAYGLQVIIQHYSYRFIYAHLDSTAHIPAGTKITQGTVIGHSGATGNARGPHLHLEARNHPYRYAIDAVDPRSCLK